MHARGNEFNGNVVLGVGEELAAVFLQPSFFVIASGAEQANVGRQALFYGVVDVHLVARPQRDRW
jgi:hypothetical protein